MICNLYQAYKLSMTRFVKIIILPKHFARFEDCSKIVINSAAPLLFILVLVLILQHLFYISVLSRVSGTFFILAISKYLKRECFT